MDAFDAEEKFSGGLFFHVVKTEMLFVRLQSSVVAHLWLFLSFSHTDKES